MCSALMNAISQSEWLQMRMKLMKKKTCGCVYSQRHCTCFSNDTNLVYFRTSPFRTLDDLANESMSGPGGPRGRAQEDSGPQRRRTSVVDHVAAAVEMLRARRTGTVTHDYDDDQHSISTLSDASDSLTGEGDAMATTGADHDAGGYGHDDDRGSGDGVVLSEGIKEAHGMARGDAVSTWHENHRRSSGFVLSLFF